jgi:hypothetical protein
VILAAAIVCIAIALMLATALSRAAVVQQRQSQQGVHQQQALWLAESGIQRAVFQLRAMTDYTGEIWEVPADMLGAAHAGVITIRVQPSPDGSGGTELQVAAKYPASTVLAATHVRNLIIPAVPRSESATGN